MFLAGERVYRTVSSLAAQDFGAVLASGVLERMTARKRLLATELLGETEASSLFEAEEGNAPAHVLAHPRIPLISYPYEWSFEALRKAALAHLELQLDLLKEGFTLSDASAFNMQFDGHEPVHIDVLSVIPYVEGERWIGYHQFQRQFLNPLVLEAVTGVSFAPWYRGSLDGLSSDELVRLLPWRTLARPSLLVHAVAPALFDRRAARAEPSASKSTLGALPKGRLVSLLEHLHRIVANLRKPRNRTTPWLDYEGVNTYSGEEREAKHDAVRAFVSEVQPRLLLDIGCNTGEYAAVAIAAGANRVVGLETDRAALDAAYLRATSMDLRFQPLAIDIANPSPAQGWRGRERGAFTDRLSADALIALAVLHHMVIAGNIPLPEATDFLVAVAPKGIIEFVPKQDRQVARLLRFRQDIFSDYDIDSFRNHLGAKAGIVSEQQITESGRTLFRYERTSA